MVINGIAARFAARPANVTREKNNALTGRSAHSAAADATIIVTHGDRNRCIVPVRITAANPNSLRGEALALDTAGAGSYV